MAPKKQKKKPEPADEPIEIDAEINELSFDLSAGPPGSESRPDTGFGGAAAEESIRLQLSQSASLEPEDYLTHFNLFVK